MMKTKNPTTMLVENQGTNKASDSFAFSGKMDGHTQLHNREFATLRASLPMALESMERRSHLTHGRGSTTR